MKKGEVIRQWKRSGGMVVGKTMNHLDISIDDFWKFLVTYEEMRGIEIYNEMAEQNAIVMVLTPVEEAEKVTPKKDMGP